MYQDCSPSQGHALELCRKMQVRFERDQTIVQPQIPSLKVRGHTRALSAVTTPIADDQ